MSGIFEQIVSAENLFAAWQQFRRGKRQKWELVMFERALEDNVFRLRDDLQASRYWHGPYHRFVVHDPKRRIIHKASVRDRVVHQAVVRVLQPIMEHAFIHDSYSCRIGKGPHAGVRRLEAFARTVTRNWQRPAWALKCDIAKFFDSIDHEILRQIFPRLLYCPKTEELLRRILGSYRSTEMRRVKRPRGLPLGSATSQLFANVYLNALDHYRKEDLRIRQYLRYTDDIVFLDPDPRVLVQHLDSMRVWLWEQRRLTLHPRKIVLRKVSQGIDFLGYVVLPHHTVFRTRTRRRLIQRIRPTNARSYLGLLRHCSAFELRTELVRLLRQREHHV